MRNGVDVRGDRVIVAQSTPFVKTIRSTCFPADGGRGTPCRESALPPGCKCGRVARIWRRLSGATRPCRRASEIRRHEGEARQLAPPLRHERGYEDYECRTRGE